MSSPEGTGYGFSWMGSYPPGSVYPGVPVTNQWFIDHVQYEKIQKPADILRRTGIEERRFALETETIRSIAFAVAKDALLQMEASGIRGSEFKGLLLGTSAADAKTLGLTTGELGDVNEADVAALVQRTAELLRDMLGIQGEAIGANWVCGTTPHLTQTAIASNAIPEGASWLQVHADKMSAYLDLSDLQTGFLFGDHATATALTRGQTRMQILHAFGDTTPSSGTISLQEGKGLNRHAVGVDGTFIRMPEGGKVMEDATEMMIGAVMRSLHDPHVQLQPNDVHELCPHQANLRFRFMLDKFWRKQPGATVVPCIDLSLTHSGNNGSASWSRRMAERWGTFEPGAIIASPFVGAGRAWNPTEYTVGNILLQAGEAE